jgi:hypothetical protein
MIHKNWVLQLIMLLPVASCFPHHAEAHDPAKVTPLQKQMFLEMLKKLPTRGEFFTEEGIQKASPFLPVLLSLNTKDVLEDQLFALLALGRGIHDSKKEHREYAAQHFEKIAHPVIKLGWAINLFRFSKEANPAIIRFLHDSLQDPERCKVIRSMLGTEFESFRKQVIAKSMK